MNALFNDELKHEEQLLGTDIYSHSVGAFLP